MRLAKLFKKKVVKISAPFLDSSVSPANPAEKRRSPRFEHDFTIDVLDSENRPADGAVRLLDVSSTGVGIESSRDLAVGQKLGFRMTISGGRSLRADARVRWIQPYGFNSAYGLQLEGMGFLSRLRLDRFLRPAAFGLIEAFDLLLHAAFWITLVAITAEVLRSTPSAAGTLFLLMPAFLLVSVGGFVIWLLASR
ncbi:MAG: PilZ domain-containing protein [Elusimicrobiota bacterium]